MTPTPSPLLALGAVALLYALAPRLGDVLRHAGEACPVATDADGAAARAARFYADLADWEARCDRVGAYVERRIDVFAFGGPAPGTVVREYPTPPPGWFAGTVDDERRAA